MGQDKAAHRHVGAGLVQIKTPVSMLLLSRLTQANCRSKLRSEESWSSKTPICLSNRECLFAKENFHYVLSKEKAQAFLVPKQIKAPINLSVRADRDSRPGRTPQSWWKRIAEQRRQRRGRA